MSSLTITICICRVGLCMHDIGKQLFCPTLLLFMEILGLWNNDYGSEYRSSMFSTMD